MDCHLRGPAFLRDISHRTHSVCAALAASGLRRRQHGLVAAIAGAAHITAMFRCILLLLFLVLSSTARAQGPRAQPIRLNYEAYIAGFNMMEVEVGLWLRPESYTLGLRSHTKGMIGALLHGESRTRVDGLFVGRSVVPSRYVSGGLWRGDRRLTDLVYESGRPVIRALVPANDEDRDEVPESLRRGSVDALSAIVMLVHEVAQNGRCDGSAVTFDGRRATKVSVGMVGMESLPAESRSSFKGEALHCRISGRQVAGFPHDAGPDDYVRKPQVADVWFAAVLPGEPSIPVLLSFETRFLGHMNMYLVGAKVGADLGQYEPKD